VPDFSGSTAIVSPPGCGSEIDTASAQVAPLSSAKWRNTIAPPTSTSRYGVLVQRATARPPTAAMVKPVGAIGSAVMVGAIAERAPVHWCA
jgi:hypothetical protein